MNAREYTRLEKLAQNIFADRVILSLDGKAWTDKPVDPLTLRAVRSNWNHLVSMMEQGSMWLCPTHEAHKPFWRFVDGRWLCLACRRLHPEVSKEVC